MPYFLRDCVVIGGLLLCVTAGSVACGSSGLANQNAVASSTTSAGGEPASGGAAGNQGGDASSGGGGAGGGESGPACPPPPACDALPPDPGATVSWNKTSTPLIVTSQGAPNHRGRDMFYNVGSAQWLVAKFAYGVFDKDLKGEDVDIYLLRGCGVEWEKLGSATTTEEGEHSTQLGIQDTGGRVYFQIPAAQALAIGRHRVHMVVKGDLSTTDFFIEVVDPSMPVFVSDVDGTLTGEEFEEFTALLEGALPTAHADSAAALHLLADKGIRPFYLTARPDWLTERTREFLDQNGYPPGIVHVNPSPTGALGDAAVNYKKADLLTLLLYIDKIYYAFGNSESDAEAYHQVGIQPVDQRIFMQFDDTIYGGRRIEAYSELLTEFEMLTPLCE